LIRQKQSKQLKIYDMATSLNTKRIIIGILSLVFLVVLLIALWKEVQHAMPGYKPAPIVDAGTKHCISCHAEKGAGKVIVEQWKTSKHAEVGVGCLECHAANKTDVDAYLHEGALIATVVTPYDCRKCHEKETMEFVNSHHADAGMIMGSLDNVLAEVVEGDVNFNSGANPAAASGCWQCHGSRVQLLTDDQGKELPPGFLTWEMRRANMQNVCYQCHTKNYVAGFYTQYDNEVFLYNEKIGKPALKLMKLLLENQMITPAEFDEQIEWTYYYLWHHEGRRARMGASMMGPDYTQWHGNYEVADRFYMEFIPDLVEIIREARANGRTQGAQTVESELNTLLNSDMHKWFLGKMDPEELKKRKEAAAKFRDRYSESK